MDEASEAFLKECCKDPYWVEQSRLPRTNDTFVISYKCLRCGKSATRIGIR